jgi:hypothetical protein
MLDDVKKFIEAIGAADDLASWAAGLERRLAWLDARQKAWLELGKSENKLVAWIAKNCSEYRDEAQKVLERLPATLGELDELASHHGWCETWDVLKKEALNAGVIEYEIQVCFHGRWHDYFDVAVVTADGLLLGEITEAEIIGLFKKGISHISLNTSDGRSLMYRYK